MARSFEIEQRNRVRRAAQRGLYDRRQVFDVIDAAWVGHIAFRDSGKGEPVVIPMLHARLGDQLIIHGATSSRLMQMLSSGIPICVAFTLVDGLVLAKSLFHHSMNYRSAVIFGRGRRLTDESERLRGLKAISDKVMPGRWSDARAPSDQEMKATSVVSVEIDSASAKVRSGDPIDAEEDRALDIWSGVVPLRHKALSPISDEYSRGLAVPDYIVEWLERRSEAGG